MRTLTRGIYGVTILALGLGTGGCVDENTWGGATTESGSISLNLTTDEVINTSKPLVRSGETDATSDPNSLSTYGVNTPAPDAFSITLVNPNGTISTWQSLSSFKSEAASKTFPVGVYTLTASSGEKGTHGFEKPYFEGSTTFTVLADRTREINLAAELANSMIKVSYEKAFEDYMTDYYVTVTTTGVTDTLTYAKTEQRPAFIDPDKSWVTLHFTTWRGKTANLDINGQGFTPLKKTLHNITFDVKKADDEEDETLSITFNDEASKDTVNIDMTAALAPGPEITCKGFTNNQTLDLTENTLSELKMDVSVPAGMTSAFLSIESEPVNTFNWPGNKIDLCTTDPQKDITGIVATGFDNGKTMATLDLLGLTGKLPTGEHIIKLLVTDKNGNTRESGLVLNSNAIDLTLDPNLPDAAKPAASYGNNNVDITLDYSGKDPSELKFFSKDENNTWQPATVVSAVEKSITTRAYATKRYKFTLQVQQTALTQLDIRAYRNFTEGDQNSESKAIGVFTIPVTLPDYTIQVDAFSKYAYLKIIADESAIPTIVKNLRFNTSDISSNISIDKSATSGYLILTGLSANTSYSGIQSSITAGAANWESGKVVSFTTETETPIPNGIFSSTTNLNITGLQVGGEYRYYAGNDFFHHTSSIDRDVPAQPWATLNPLTAYVSNTNKNTWFIVPSTFLNDKTDGGVIVRSVGYHHTGTSITKKEGSDAVYYCTNAPSSLDKTAGELFLGTYSFNGTTASRTDGIGFTSRPNSITFNYTYTPTDKTDKGYAYIELFDTDKNSLGGETFKLSDSGSKTVNLSYSPFGKKASTLKISFKSSNQGTSVPISTPSGTALDEGVRLKDSRGKTLPANSYHAVATGSELKIYNVTAKYNTAP